MGLHRLCAACGKVCYRGAGEAKRAHGSAHYRIRVYYCADGGAFHVTNSEKRHQQFSRGDPRSPTWRK